MRTIEEISTEVDYLIKSGLTPHFDTAEKRNNEVLRIQTGEARAYLASTDWYIIRFMETGVDVPSGVHELRADAREKISNNGG